jgi:hypothetical protein
MRVGVVLGLFLIAFGIVLLLFGGWGGFILITVGILLSLLKFGESRTANVLFGHFCIFLGCFLITWGIYLLPYSKPTLIDIFTKPLFWGLFSLMGGICANYHGFCRCVKSKS